MKVEVLYSDGCPNYEPVLSRLRALIAAAGVEAEVQSLLVVDPEDAERERFLGSPTVRVDGRDVEPGAGQRTDFGLKCRLYVTQDGVNRMPADHWVLLALKSGRAREDAPPSTRAGG